LFDRVATLFHQLLNDLTLFGLVQLAAALDAAVDERRFEQSKGAQTLGFARAHCRGDVGIDLRK
jgi:hypothetical protein